MNLTSKMDPKSKKNFRKTQDQKVYAPWIHVQMTSNFESDISKHIKKKYQKTPGKFFLKKIFFWFMYPTHRRKEIHEKTQNLENLRFYLIMISSFVFDCLNLKRWLERSFHKRISIYWKGNKFLRVLVFYPREKFFTPSPTTILIHTPRRCVWFV